MNATVAATSPPQAQNFSRSTGGNREDGFLSVLASADELQAQTAGSGSERSVTATQSAKPFADCVRQKRQLRGETPADAMPATNVLTPQVVAQSAPVSVGTDPNADAWNHASSSCEWPASPEDVAGMDGRLSGLVPTSLPASIALAAGPDGFAGLFADETGPSGGLQSEDSGSMDSAPLEPGPRLRRDNSVSGLLAAKEIEATGPSQIVASIPNSATSEEVPALDDGDASIVTRDMPVQAGARVTAFSARARKLEGAKAETTAEERSEPSTAQVSLVADSIDALQGLSTPVQIEGASAQPDPRDHPQFVKAAGLTPGRGAASQTESPVAATLPSATTVHQVSTSIEDDAAERNPSHVIPDNPLDLDPGIPEKARPWDKESETAGEIGLDNAPPVTSLTPARPSFGQAGSHHEEPATPPGASATTETQAIAPPLHASQLLQRMERTEIHIGLETENFGSIRLQTSLLKDAVGAAVSTSHPGLRDALLLETPSLEQAMVRHSLRLDGVRVDAGSSNSNFNSFAGNERQPQARPEAPVSRWTSVREPRTQLSSGSALPVVAAGGRLDVRA